MKQRLQVAFFTGQSDPPSCALAPDQEAFLDALPVTESERVRYNFPFDETTPPWAAIPLWRASLNNIGQFYRSRGAAFARAHREAVLTMLSSAERTVLLAGSCGIELLNNLALPEGVLRTVFVFGYGPAARRRPACRHLLVGSRRDLISRFWFTVPDAWVGVGHLDYLASDELRARCVAFIERARTEP
ncbi:MAG TPA: hypothetical protein VGX96_15970 [Candidatus Elarobacter sp.]|nr:hypothetical protein [Candidatus Elarobacter sp.]